MTSPIVVGTTAIVAVPERRNRETVRFQNVGSTVLYFAKGKNLPTTSRYDFLLIPMLSNTNSLTSAEGDDSVIASKIKQPSPMAQTMVMSSIEIESISEFKVVSSGSNGNLAILETEIIRRQINE